MQNLKLPNMDNPVSISAICQAHAQLESDYNVGGWLRERPSNRRRNASTGVQLSRMGHCNPYDWVDILDDEGDSDADDVRERISSSYFDVRYYKGIGTIHFFARSQELMDRLNRWVGRERQWLPPEDAKVNKDFWLQYDSAEKFDREVRKEVSKNYGGAWNHPLERLSRGCDDEGNAAAALDAALATVHTSRGIDIDRLIEDHTEQQLLLAA